MPTVGSSMYDEYEYPKNLLNHTIGYSTSLKGGERNKTSKYPNPKSKIEKNIYCFFGVSWYQYQYQGTYTGYWVLGTGDWGGTSYTTSYHSRHRTPTIQLRYTISYLQVNVLIQSHTTVSRNERIVCVLYFSVGDFDSLAIATNHEGKSD